jgi:hypothetical protein
LPAHTLWFPVTGPGIAAAPATTRLLAVPVPQLLIATTESVDVENVDGKLILAALKLLGPETEAPLLAVHK